MSDMISMDKQYVTRDGRDVRIYAVDGGDDDRSVHGAIKHESGKWSITSWNENGAHSYSGGEFITPCDLIEVKPKITRTYWLVHWHAPNAIAQAFPTCERARDYAAGRECVSSVTGPHIVEFTEGEGLS